MARIGILLSADSLNDTFYFDGAEDQLEADQKVIDKWLKEK